jgi:uncharacterized protein (UPF0212 family)
MLGHIVVSCDECGDELELSEDCALVVTYAEMAVFTAAHDGHASVAIEVRTQVKPTTEL